MSLEEMHNMRTAQVGNYRFTGKVLGKGSFAVVEEALHFPLKMKVSVKTINLLKCNAYVLRNLKREATVLQQLDHPHILRLFETMKYANKYCMVTELVEGWNLCTYVRNQKHHHLQEVTARKYVRQIVTALAYMHGKNIVHRDLKLENIMLDLNKENVKLIDFGLSNYWRIGSPLRTLCGSPEYCAPELFVSGTEYGKEVDMWALGVILYTMAVGRLPFPCVSSLMRIPDKKSKFILMINSGLSDAHLDRVVNYSPEFSTLLRGLMNPDWKKRMTVEEALKDTWMSNNNHWTALTQYDSLDSYDLSVIRKKVCAQLEINEDRLKADMASDPTGKVAGYFNIIMYNFLHSNFQDPATIKSSESLTQISHHKTRANMCAKGPSNLPSTKHRTYVSHCHAKEVDNKLWVVGIAHKINEVVRSKKPLRRGIYTTTTGPPKCQSSGRSSSSKTSDQNQVWGDRLRGFKEFPLGYQRQSTSSVKSKGTKSMRAEDNSVQPQLRYRRDSAELFQPIPPTKVQLRTKCV